MKKLLLFTTCIFICGCMLSQIINVPGDQPTIQAGIDAAVDEDTVLVAQGTYYENVFFRGKAIFLASNYIFSTDSSDIYNTIIDGSQAVNPDSASCVMFMNEEDTTSVLYGFTIIGGTGVKYGSLQAQHGGGICGYNAGGKIIHNIITGNSVTNENNAIGGGISFITSSGQNWLIVKNNTIRNNHAAATDLVALGGGIYSSINVIISNNLIENNSSISVNSEGNGAGVGCHSLFTQEGILLLQNNTISNNFADGLYAHGVGIFVKYYTSTLLENEITDNYCTIDKYWGVGALIAEPDGKTYVLNNVFQSNTGPIPASPGAGGGLTIRDSFDEVVLMDGNYFIDNTAKHGGGFYARNSYNMVLSNNLFAGDSAQLGGGIGLYHSQTDKQNDSKALSIPLIVNNTFFDNHVSESGGAIRLTGDAGVDLVTFNNIFYDNESSYGNDIFNNSSAELIQVYYSNIDEDNITGSWDGNYNFAGFPYFTDDLCHIDCATPSPCINAGIHELEIGGIIYQAPELDFDGEIRPQDELFDIGADEQELCTFISELNPSEYEFRLQVNPNPTSGVLHLRFSILDPRFSILEIYSIDGVMVKTLKRGVFQAGEHEQTFDISDLPDGIYFVRLQVGNQAETTKVILSK